MWPDEDLKVDLDIAIQGSVETYAQEFREQYALDSNEPPEGMEWETWYELLALNAAAQQLAGAALNMYRPGGLTRRELNLPAQLEAAAESEKAQVDELLRHLKELGTPDQDWPAIEAAVRPLLPDPEGFKHRFFLAAIQIELAYSHDVLPSLYGVSTRLLTLLDYLTSESNEKVRAYLVRVARCFLYDMVPELFLMSRAVMEAALENRLPEQYMRKVRGLASNERVTLSLWINEAASSGLFAPDVERAAKRIADIGGKVAHGKKVPTTTPERVLADLHLIVTALERQIA